MNCLDLFHANDEKRCRQFLEEDDYLIISEEDGVWLGSGMYFWDNLGNAKYWRNEKTRKKFSCGKLSIVKANVSLEKCLDLTDDDVLDFVMRCWKILQSKTKGLTNIESGFILNALFDRYILGDISFANDYEVLKGIAEYDRAESPLFSNRKKPRMTNKHRIVYNVKKANCILTREGVSC